MDKIRWATLGLITFFLIVLGATAGAAEAPAGKDGIPSTAVARLKIGKGTAWVRSGGSGDWEEAATNFPLAEKSRVSIPRDSEAEIQFRGSQSLLLHGGSEVDIRQLGEKEASYRLRSGDAALSLPNENFAPVRFTVPGNRQVRMDAPGRYSLAVDGGTTRFAVVSGEGAVAEADGSGIPVKAGEEASIGQGVRVGRARTAAAAAKEPPPETTLTEPEAAAEIPPSVAGELRPYGEWVSTPEYGYVWRPYVDDGWEPYYYGRWVWVLPYGWTWVGYEPWGWWPYHTGWWWPSPVFGWVWCPFHSFVSVDFFFGRTFFFGNHVRFIPANVRFVGRDQFVRWVPLRPGETRPDTRSFARGDIRLARWDQPVERGSVRVRRDGGEPVTWEGRGGRPRTATSGRETGITGRGRGSTRPTGVTRPRSDNRGDGVPSVRPGMGSRSFPGSGGRGPGNFGNPGIYRGPGRSSGAGDPAFRSGGFSRAPARRGIPTGSASMGRGGR